MNKKTIWILIVLVLIIGAGLCFWLYGDKVKFGFSSDSFPRPPALPE